MHNPLSSKWPLSFFIFSKAPSYLDLVNVIFLTGPILLQGVVNCAILERFKGEQNIITFLEPS